MCAFDAKASESTYAAGIYGYTVNCYKRLHRFCARAFLCFFVFNMPWLDEFEVDCVAFFVRDIEVEYVILV